ncbi:unnamed protein product, partial [marine sediment metagenome]
FQLLAYHLVIAKSLDSDGPSNLANFVTVK